MARVVRRKIDKKAEESLWKEFMERIHRLESPGDLQTLFGLFFTKDEKMLILRRLALMKLIKNGKKYREMKDILDVSGTTISAVKAIISGKGYREK